jgi:hypothetical protein
MPVMNVNAPPVLVSENWWNTSRMNDWWLRSAYT